MYCPQCGVPNDESARFCTSCGAVLPTGAAPEPAAPGTSAVPPGAQPHPPPYPQIPPQQGYYQATPPGAHTARPSVPTYLGWAIACFFLCFWPTAIVAMVHAGRVNKKLALGDYPGALASSRQARTWCWVSFAVLIVAIIIAVIAAVTSTA
jgi:hypothetical protein